MPEDSLEIADDYSLEDEHFDLMYPPEVRKLSRLHWTPWTIARRAARLLVTQPGIKVLDIGCGSGKFCIVGALTTGGYFTGIEQRKRLVDVARSTIKKMELPNAEILHANITTIQLSDYDAFYLFNPFEENLFKAGRIDASVELSLALYKRYVNYVVGQLSKAPIGTRIITYGGSCYEVPECYDCRQKMCDERLLLWVKTREAGEEPIHRKLTIQLSEELFKAGVNISRSGAEKMAETTEAKITKNFIPPGKHDESQTS